MTSTVSFLIPVYAGADATQFQHTLDSLWAQTRPAEEVVVVEDGPLTTELERVLDDAQATHPELRRVRLARNQGAGPALQAGLGTITTDFIARIDADDLAYPERIEKQLAYFAQHPRLTVLGTAVTEFDDSTFTQTGDLQQSVGKVRALPETHEAILKYARINTPVNHPSVMMRTAAVRDAGGYQKVHHMEDYDLWARLLMSGAQFHNLAEPLTYFRTSQSQFARRTGKGMFAAERHMQRNLAAYGLVSKPRAALNLVVRTAYRLLPAAALQRAYGALFHRR
ncbi:glycosyltransferase [Corynebacterium sp. H130]|uniref:glycosyltransferase n=1 Tax=Corynebacterium sp. H130 TaxID=3133444 RepID=UPI0030ABA8FC